MTIDPTARATLAATRTIDLTTTGRRSGLPARIEIWWFHVDDRFVITGTPGKRDWYANVLADPSVTVHTPLGDLPAVAVPVRDAEFRRRVFTDPQISWYRNQSQLTALVETAPMIEIRFTAQDSQDGLAPGPAGA